MVEFLAGEFRYTRYVYGAQVLVANEVLSSCKYFLQPRHIHIIWARKVVLTLDCEHVHDVLLAAELVLELLTVDLEDRLVVHHRRHLVMLLLLLLLLLIIQKLAGGTLTRRSHPFIGRHVPEFVGQGRIFITARVS